MTKPSCGYSGRLVCFFREFCKFVRLLVQRTRYDGTSTIIDSLLYMGTGGMVCGYCVFHTRAFCVAFLIKHVCWVPGLKHKGQQHESDGYHHTERSGWFRPSLWLKVSMSAHPLEKTGIESCFTWKRFFFTAFSKSTLSLLTLAVPQAGREAPRADPSHVEHL